jgi:hypothetical protein
VIFDKNEPEDKKKRIKEDKNFRRLDDGEM